MQLEKIKIPLYSPYISKNQKKYVNQCLDTNWISSKGQFVNSFEDKFSLYTNSKYSVAVSNGTVAIHLAMLALGIKDGDHVLVPSFTYIAPVNAIKYVGATPVFVDSNPDDLQMDLQDLEKKITKDTKAILAVHVYGQSGEMNKLKQISKKYKLILLEDCAEALGASFKGKKVGSFGSIATYSFYGNKTITTGEGGMVTTNNKALKDKILKLKGQGLSKNKEYWHDIIGYNFRMTNICAAIGLAQLENINTIMKLKRDIASYYKKELKGLPLRLHNESQNTIHSFWLCSIMLDKLQDRDKLRLHLARRGIETRPFFYPVHTMQMYRKPGLKLKNTEKIFKSGINIPSWPGMTKKNLDEVVFAIRSFFN
jgi:perosamine synthetase